LEGEEKNVIITRYIVKEVLITAAALTTILLLIFLSNQFVHYLSRSAEGQLPGIIVLKLMMLEIPNLLGLLLPLGFYMAVLVAYGRLYADSEMIVLQACGYTQRQLLATTMAMAFILAVIVGCLMIWASPVIAKDRRQLISGGGVSTLIQAIIPQRFQAVSHGNRVFYVDKMSRDHQRAQGIFLAQRESVKHGNGQAWSLVWADEGYAEEDEKQGAQFVVLKNGKEYQGTPGQADFRIMSFKQYKVRLPQPNESAVSSDVSTLPTSALLPVNNPDLKKAAELQWRLSVPLMAVTLGLLAVPLSKVEPRRGKLAKMLPAVIIYIIYANLMFVARDWIINSQIPAWVGFWWLHGLVLLFGTALIMLPRWRRQ